MQGSIDRQISGRHKEVGMDRQMTLNTERKVQTDRFQVDKARKVLTDDFSQTRNRLTDRFQVDTEKIDRQISEDTEQIDRQISGGHEIDRKIDFRWTRNRQKDRFQVDTERKGKMKISKK